jgi:hypothetical protein
MTPTVDAAPPAPGLIARLAGGVAGGLAGGLVFGLLMQVTGVIPIVAQLVARDSLLVGWTVHMSIAAFIGATYALILGPFATALSISTVLGAFYGLVWWVLGGLTLMPLRLGMGLFVFDSAAWQSLAGHFTYGLVLGAAFLVVAQALAGPRTRGRHAAGSAATHPGPGAVARPATLPGPGGVALPAALPWSGDPHTTSPDGHPRRTAVPPLSAEARSLRMRQHRPGPT